MNSGGYTYLNLENRGNKLQVAIPETQVNVGDKVAVANGMVMKNFESKSLGRTFDTIVFSEGIVKRQEAN